MRSPEGGPRGLGPGRGREGACAPGTRVALRPEPAPRARRSPGPRAPRPAPPRPWGILGAGAGRGRPFERRAAAGTVAAGAGGRSAPPRPAHGMAALLPPGPPPDELDFIQAYEEVRERYKGRAPWAPHPPATCCPARPWRVLRPLTPCPRRPVRSRPSRARLAASPGPPDTRAAEPGRAPAVMPLIGHLAVRWWGGPRWGGLAAGVQCPQSEASRHVGPG